MADSFRLTVLKKLTDHLKEITVANGFSFDIGDKVYRGRTEFGAETQSPFLSIVESTKPDSGLYAGDLDSDRKAAWPMFIQGWATNDVENPSDTAYQLMADVEFQLGKIVAQDRQANPIYPDIFLLGPGDLANKRNTLIVGLVYGPGVVSPPISQVSSQAFFFLPVWITIAEKLGQPYYEV